MARVQLVEKKTAPPDVETVYQKIEANGARIINLYKAVANSPKVMLNIIRLGNSIIGQMALPPRLREIVILRVARLTGSEYEWAQHTAIALEVGLTKEQVDAISKWQNSPEFKPEERTILQFTDEVTRNVGVSDHTFNELKKLFNDQLITELTVTVGYYSMLARILVALQVDIDEVSAGSASNLIGGQRSSPE